MKTEITGAGVTLAGAAVEEGFGEEENHCKSTVDFCVEHAACAVVGERTAENVGAVGAGEVDVEAGGRRLLSNGGDMMLESFTMKVGIERKESCKGQWPVLVKRDFDQRCSTAASLTSVETKVKLVAGLVCRDVFRDGVWGGVVEKIFLEK